MTKRRVRWKRGLAVAALCAGMALSGCASQKAGSDAPELPAKHWLEDVPGVPVENKSKLEAVIPNLYDPAKKFSFEDCVFLTIQQSPLLVNSAVELEIKRLALTDAVWKYLPEPRMTVEVGNTLTYYNEGRDDVPSNYGKVVPRIGFYARFPNPVESYFNHQAQKIMVNLAISTHRKAVGEAIYKVAQAYLRLEAKNEILRIQKEVAPLARETTRYWEQLESADGQEDYFWRLTFDFPLIDWNRRYRGVQAARMKKAQAFHELSRKRTDYSNTWLQCEQRVALAETNRRLAKVHFETAEMRYKEARISFETGLGDMPAMSSAHEAMVQSRIKLIEAELELKLANLEWMYVANLLQERFLGLPATEIEK